ncbi:primase C-terminal domain-containing protein [Microlunatus sp. Y2014]|uniref:primase C-terminal domain-containing protein n=1 Tax=Microlunatus sp. Y2014 TaxID=3418488 RepID=UPI003DA76895
MWRPWTRRRCGTSSTRAPSPRSATGVGASRVRDAQRLAGWVSALGEGERNRGLFWAACRLAEAGVAPSVTLDALGPAAEQIGLPPREVVTTIRSAYRATSARPARTDASAPAHGEAPRRPARAEEQVLS